MRAMLIYLSLCCLLALSEAAWVRVWEDNFDWNGGLDLTKWEYDEGGHGWGWFICSGKYRSTLVICFSLGNNEEQYYTRNRLENARCELFPGSLNGRLILEAHKVSRKQATLSV
jgi:hypothetical protein